MTIWLIVALILALIIGLPYSWYLDGQQLEQPVVVFKARIWREALLSFSILIFAGAILVLAGALLVWPRGLLSWLAGFALALIGLGLYFLILRLHLSYWHHDRYATLTVYTQEQRAEYRNENVLIRFALADVVRITSYNLNSRAIYTYQIFALRDGTELLLTCLMYSMLGPQELMPDVPRQAVRRFGCWLPGDELNFPTLL